MTTGRGSEPCCSAWGSWAPVNPPPRDGATGSRQVHVTSVVSPGASAPGFPPGAEPLSACCSPSQHGARQAVAGSLVPWPVSPTSSCRCREATLTVLPGSPTGSYEEAGARLQEAPHPTPPPEAARARRGLLWLKKGDVPAASRDLQCLAETDAGDLGFLLRLLEASERQSLAQVPAPPRSPSEPLVSPPLHPRGFSCFAPLGADSRWRWAGWACEQEAPRLALSSPDHSQHFLASLHEGQVT